MMADPRPLFEQIAAAGLRVNNLFQRADGTAWQANITDGLPPGEKKKYWGWGTGSCPASALAAAWDRARTEPGSPIYLPSTKGLLLEKGNAPSRLVSVTPLSVGDLGL